MKLDKRLWGRYRCNGNRQPLCTVPECYKRATHRFKLGQNIGIYCERHAAHFGTEFLMRAWDVLGQVFEQEDEA